MSWIASLVVPVDPDGHLTIERQAITILGWLRDMPIERQRWRVCSWQGHRRVAVVKGFRSFDDARAAAERMRAEAGQQGG